jgi:hypothetical protein
MTVSVCVHVCVSSVNMYVYIYTVSVGSFMCMDQIEKTYIPWIIKNILGFSENENSYHLNVNVDSVFKSWRWRKNVFFRNVFSYPAPLLISKARRYSPKPKVKYCVHMSATLNHVLWKSTTPKSVLIIKFHITVPFMHKCFVWSFPIKFSE